MRRSRAESSSAAQAARYERLLAKLRDARLEAGLTQAQSAKALRKPQSFVSKCESGERRIDVVELERFAEVYGKPILFFYERR
jgi:transcriptional regulator with XRE-family HTH domain